MEGERHSTFRFQRMMDPRDIQVEVSASVGYMNLQKCGLEIQF